MHTVPNKQTNKRPNNNNNKHTSGKQSNEHLATYSFHSPIQILCVCCSYVKRILMLFYLYSTLIIDPSCRWNAFFYSLIFCKTSIMYSHSHIHILQPARIDVRALSRAIIHTHTHTINMHERTTDRSRCSLSGIQPNGVYGTAKERREK